MHQLLLLLLFIYLIFFAYYSCNLTCWVAHCKWDGPRNHLLFSQALSIAAVL